MTKKKIFIQNKKEYDQELRKNNYITLYIGMILSIIFHLFFILFDYYLVPDNWIKFLIIRLCVSTIILISIIFISFKRFKKYVIEAFFLAFTVIEIAICYMLPNSGEEIIPYILGFTICIYLSGLLLRKIIYVLLFHLIITIACVGAFIIWPYNMNIKTFIIMICILITASCSSFFSAFFLDKNMKKEFVSRKKLEEAKKKLESLDEMKNDFIANITHEFRSPLTVIIALAEMNIYNFNDDEQIKNMDLIYEAGVKLKNTIDKLLDIAKMDAKGMTLTITKTDPVAILEEIYQFYSSAVFNSGIKIYKYFPSLKISNFYTDVIKFEEIINNIISNAVKFVDYEDGVINISVKDKAKCIEISIEDNGIGIPQEKINAIFKRFEQADGGRNNKYRGTGIGLAYAKQLVELLNGKIWAKSEGKGKGAAFFIELPKGKDKFLNNSLYEFINKNNYDKTYEYSTKKKHDSLKVFIQSEINKKLDNEEIKLMINETNKFNEYNYKKSVIIIIDDDKQIRDIVVEYLKNDGYSNFILAPDGSLGLDAVYKYKPDIIISDFNMPGLRGDKFHDQLINNPRFKQIPFVFLTAVKDKQIKLERTKKGVSAYFEKPIDKKYFLITVERLLKKYFDYLKVCHLANIDELTGLYNRRELFKSLYHELSIRKYRNLSLIFLDIDHFKKCNDIYGHIIGDEIIKKMGMIIKSTIRNYDIAGRYGGDEFLIILPDTNIQQAKNIVKILQEKIKNSFTDVKNNQLNISASFGLSSLIDHNDYIADQLNINDIKNIYEVKNKKNANWKSIEQYKIQIADLLLDMADKALYNAKFTKCNKCSFKSEKELDFKNNQCSKCGSINLNHGRDKFYVFSW